MGKIKQLREDQIVNGGSQEHIYPVTHTKAVYSKDRENLQDIIDSIREGNFLKDGSIKTRHLKDKAVTTSKLDDGSVDNRVLAIDAVTYDKLKDKSVITEKLNDRAVTTEKVEEKAITNTKLGDQSVDGRVVREASIEGKHLGNNAVSTPKIASRSVTNEKIAHDSVSRAELTPDVRNSIDKKADAEQVNNSLYNLEKKIGDRFVVEGDVTNLPDEEDLTSVKESERDVLKLADRSYAPEKFSGKGYKILRRNINQVSIAVTKIKIESAPSADGTLSFTVNGKETQVAVSATTDNTTALVSQKVASALQESMTEYEVLVETSLIILTRKSGGLVTPSVFSASTTGVVCTITDSTEIKFQNILTQDMINQANTIYVIRYDFTLGEDIIIPANCVLEFNGGSISGAYTIIGANTEINAGLVKIFNINVTLSGIWNISEAYPEWFGAKGDGVTDDTTAVQKCVDLSGSIKCDAIISAKTYGVSSPVELPRFSKIIGVDRHYSVLKAISSTAAILKSSSNATLLTIDNIRVEGNGLALKGIHIGGVNKVAHSVFQNIRAHNCIDNNLYFEKLELSQINNILCDGAKVGIYLKDPMAVYLREIKTSDSTENNFLVLNSNNLKIEYLYTFNENVANQVLCRLINVSNCTIYNPHFEPQKDVACNLLITSNGALASNYLINCNGIMIVKPNFCGLNYAGDLIKLEIVDNTESTNYRPSISNIKVYNGEFLIPKDGSYVVNNIDCEDLILEDCIQKEQGNYTAPWLCPILDSQINNPNGHSIKKLFSFGGKETLLNNIFPIIIDSTSAYFRFINKLPAGTYYLSTQKRMLQTAIYIGANLANLTQIVATGTSKESYATLVLQEDIPAGYVMKIARGSFTTYYKDIAFVLSDKPVNVNGQEKAYLPTKGASDVRPMTNAVHVGFVYFDTTLEKPIFAKEVAANGTVTWVDATGTQV